MLIRQKTQSLLRLKKKQPLEGVLLFSESKQWWGGLFGEYGHVDIIVRDEERWVRVNPSLDATFISSSSSLSELVPDGAKAVKFRMLVNLFRYRVPHIIQPFTCVEVVKSFLGVRSPFILTPKHLYKRLLKDGCIQETTN